MSASFQSVIRKTGMRHLIEVKRHLKNVGRTAGFVVGASDSLVLFHVFDSDCFCLNGYTVIREEDISHHRVFNKSEYWQYRAVRRFRIKAARLPGLSMVSFPELMISIAKRFPLLTVHVEEKKPEVCYIGPLISTTDRTFTIDDLNASAEWTGPRRIRFQDLTRVDFGGGYEKALAATAPKRPAGNYLTSQDRGGMDEARLVIRPLTSKG